MSNFDAYVDSSRDTEADKVLKSPRGSWDSHAPPGSSSRGGSAQGEATPPSPVSPANQKRSMFSFAMNPSFVSIMGGNSKDRPVPSGPPLPLPDNAPGSPDNTPQTEEQLREECVRLRLMLEKSERNEQALKDLNETLKAHLEKCDERAEKAEDRLKQEEGKRKRLELLLLDEAGGQGGSGHGSGASVDFVALQSELIKLQDERDAAQADAKDVNERLRSYLAQIKELKNDKGRAIEVLREAQEDALVAREEVEDMRSELWKVQKMVESKEQELGSLREELDNLAHLLDQANEEKAVLQREKAEIVRLRREELKVKNNLQNQMGLLVKGRNEVQQHLEEQQKKNISSTLQLMVSQAAKTRAARSREELQKRVEELQSELAKVQGKLDSPSLSSSLGGSVEEEELLDESEGEVSVQSSGNSYENALNLPLTQLERESSQNQAELNRLRAELQVRVEQESELAKVRQQLVEERQEYQRTEEALEEKLRQHQEKLRQKEEELEELKLELKSAMLRAEDLQGEVDRHVLGSRAESVESDGDLVTGLQTALQEKNREVERLKEETEQWDTSYTESEKRVTALENRLSQVLRQQKEAVDAAVREVNEKLQQLEADVAEAESAREILQQRLDTVTLARDACARESEARLALIKELESGKEGLQKRLDEVSGLEQMSVLLQQKAQEKEETCQRKDEECQGLREDVVARDIRIKKLQLDFLALQQQLESASSASMDAPSVRGELMEAQQEIRKLKLEKDQMKQAHMEQLEGLAVRVRELEGAQELYKGKYADMADAAFSLESAEAAASAAKRELSDSRAEAAQLRLELEAIKCRAVEHQQRALQLEGSLEQSRREVRELHQERQVAGGLQARAAELEASLESERRRAAQAVARSEQQLQAVQAQVREEIEFLKANAMSSLEEIQALEGVMQQVEAYDIRMQPLHRVRLVQHSSSFRCAVCHAPGSAWGWRCIVPHCSDSIHLTCLTGRGGR